MPRGVQVPDGVRRLFWSLVRQGSSATSAALAVGVSGESGRLWFRQAGGVLPREPDPIGRRLQLEDREEIALLHAQGLGVRAIGRAMDRCPSVISRELARNRNAKGEYRAVAAQRKADARARRPRTAKLAEPGPLRDFVIACLRKEWSPEQIANLLKVNHPHDPAMRVCHETIYQSLYVQSRGALRRDLAERLRTQRATRKPQGRTGASGEDRRGRLPGTISISERPAEADDRAVPGHWEGDLIIGKDNGSAIGTLVERSTRFVMLVHLPGRRTADQFYDALVPTIKTLPDELRRSLTWDNGKEMARHADIAAAADIKIFFADPGKPWQRGSNENTNGLLRQYFPKGTSLRQHTPEDLQRVAAKLNSRPRKTLEWRTPAQAINELLSRPFEPVLH